MSLHGPGHVDATLEHTPHNALILLQKGTKHNKECRKLGPSDPRKALSKELHSDFYRQADQSRTARDAAERMAAERAQVEAAAAAEGGDDEGEEEDQDVDGGPTVVLEAPAAPMGARGVAAAAGNGGGVYGRRMKAEHDRRIRNLIEINQAKRQDLLRQINDLEGEKERDRQRIRVLEEKTSALFYKRQELKDLKREHEHLSGSLTSCSVSIGLCKSACGSWRRSAQRSMLQSKCSLMHWCSAWRE